MGYSLVATPPDVYGVAGASLSAGSSASAAARRYPNDVFGSSHQRQEVPMVAPRRDRLSLSNSISSLSARAASPLSRRRGSTDLDKARCDECDTADDE